MAETKKPATTVDELRARAANLREMAGAIEDDRLRLVYIEQAENFEKQAEALEIDEAVAQKK